MALASASFGLLARVHHFNASSIAPGGAAEQHVAACSVIAGPFAIAMQGVLFSVTVAVLVYKKHTEGGSRTWFEFCLDGSKQFAGAGWIHVANMLCAVFFAKQLHGVDGCTWYAANIIIDDTLGVFVELCLLQGAQRLLQAIGIKSLIKLLESGAYYDDDRRFLPWNYAGQLALWLLIVTAMKLSMVALMQALPVLVKAHNYLLSPLAESPKSKLFVVMIIVPCAMNSVQFWLTDNFIKKKESAGADASQDEDSDNSEATQEEGVERLLQA